MLRCQLMHRIVSPRNTQDTGGGKNDEGDNTISFAEFLAGLEKTEVKTDPGFHLSQGLVATTLEENRRLMAEISATLPRVPSKSSSTKRPGSQGGKR